MVDRATGKGKGYGFVTLDSPDTAARVLAKPDHAIKDRPVEVPLAPLAPRHCTQV